MEMEGPWELTTSEPTNAYLYNGKELNKDFGLNMLDYHNRWLDPVIGRFTSVDKLADHPNQIDKSVYAYAWNNPVGLTDPDGNCPNCKYVLEGFRRVFNAAGEAIDRTSAKISATYENVVSSVSTTLGLTKVTVEERAETTGYFEVEFNVAKFTDPGNYSKENGYKDPENKPTVDIDVGVKSDVVNVTSVKTEMKGAYYQSVTKTSATTNKSTTTQKVGVQKKAKNVKVAAAVSYKPSQNGQPAQTGVEVQVTGQVSPNSRVKAKIEAKYENRE